MRCPLVKKLHLAFDPLWSKMSDIRDCNNKLFDRAIVIRKLAKSIENYPENTSFYRHGDETHDPLQSLLIRYCPQTWQWAKSCYHNPFYTKNWRITMALGGITEVLGAYGQCFTRLNVNYEYANMGDPYATTLIYKVSSDNLFIGCWGDIVDKQKID